MAPRSYVIVSPARNEGAFIEATLASVVRQTVLPALWVIVDDGSADDTAEKASRFAERHDFIRFHRRAPARLHGTGAPVIEAFKAGMGIVGDSDRAEFLVKLDCDLSFEPSYFERLLDRMAREPRLGIASGVYHERDSHGRWRPIAMPDYHAAGACKVLRRECYRDIGGFAPAAGWDTLDEIRAMARGWRTGHFDDCHLYHLKPEGSRAGAWRTAAMHGRIDYRLGTDPAFLLVKLMARLSGPPPLLAALGHLAGYGAALCSRESRLATGEERRLLRRLQRQRLRGALGAAVPERLRRVARPA